MSFTAPTSPTKLLVRKGQPIEAAHHNGLVRLAEQLIIARGPVKGRQMPDGFTPHIKITQVTQVDHPFKVSVEAISGTGASTEYGATFSLGTVEGIIPEIEKVGLDTVDVKGNPPVLKIKPEAWKSSGTAKRSLLMLTYTLDPNSHIVTAVTPIAVPQVPDFQPWTWNKLIAILVRIDTDITVKQMCFFNQRFYAINPSSGRFTPIPMNA